MTQKTGKMFEASSHTRKRKHTFTRERKRSKYTNSQADAGANEQTVNHANAFAGKIPILGHCVSGRQDSQDMHLNAQKK